MNTQKYSTIPKAGVFIEHKNTLYAHLHDPVRHLKGMHTYTQAPSVKCFDSEQERTNLSGMFSPQLGAKQLWIHFLNLCPSFLTFHCLLLQSAFFFSPAEDDCVFYSKGLGTSSRNFMRHSTDWLPLEKPAVFFPLSATPLLLPLSILSRWSFVEFYLSGSHC